MTSEEMVYILLPDGIGLRNFIYTDFLDHGEAVVWSPLDYLEPQIPQKRVPRFFLERSIDTLKSALIRANILQNYRRSDNASYVDYLFPPSGSLKSRIKHTLVDLLAKTHATPEKIEKLRRRYLDSLRNSSYYHQSHRQLESQRPSFVFCTHQRMLNAAAPILAARDLGIPTGTFIFSWDNLPKGNLSVPAEHLFVWSEYMKREAMEYFPHYDEEHIHVVGTPQFVPYTDESLRESRASFCGRYGLDPDAHIVCFSGDDVTTSPYDPLYLRDTAEAVRRLNTHGKGKYQILFRRCPVDFSDRYDRVLEEYRDVIRKVPPLWKRPEGAQSWESVIPTPEDVQLLVNTVLHSATAINVGSTIAHDFACMGKTSCYINYNAVQSDRWDIHKIYQFVNFKSMEGLDPVYRVDSPEMMEETLLKAIEDRDGKMEDARRWLETVALHPLSDTNRRIWQTIREISKQGG